MSVVNSTFVIIGGGIAGVTCAETLSDLTASTDPSVVLISSSSVVKTVTNIKAFTQLTVDFDVKEEKIRDFEDSHTKIRIIQGTVIAIDHTKGFVRTDNNISVYFDKLAICTGGSPKFIDSTNPYVIALRDTESIKSFQLKLKKCSRIAVVGNGGIATELVFELRHCDIVWAVKHEFISHTFIDAGAAQFFLPYVNDTPENPSVSKHRKYTTDDDFSRDTKIEKYEGGALGPHWATDANLSGCSDKNVHIEYEVEVSQIMTYAEIVKGNMLTNIHKLENEKQKWSVYLLLTNGKIYGCDLVVNAIGTTPRGDIFHDMCGVTLDADGGILVDETMATTVSNIYAAGDVCSTKNWKTAKHWLQMKLWSQARQMGAYCAKCMLANLNNEIVPLDFCFEIFTHATTFFGFKVVLLGLFNGQNLDENYEVLLRVTKGVEYIKLVKKDGFIHGAILIGETDLEETFENLILNQIDVSRYGDDLLNPNINIEDYFD